MSNKQTIKSTLTRAELIETIGSLRTQVINWRQVAVSIAAELLIVDPSNELFTNENMQEAMLKHIIAFTAEKLEHQKEVLYNKRVIADCKVMRIAGEVSKFSVKNTETTLDGLIVLFSDFRKLQKEFMHFDKEKIASAEGSAMMDKLDIEINKLYTHFSGRQSKEKPIEKPIEK